MTLSTTGKAFQAGRTVPLCVVALEANREWQAPERFCFVHFAHGPTTFRVGSKRCSIPTPACLCLNEREALCVEASPAPPIEVVFHPAALNGKFSFDNIRISFPEFTYTDLLDRSYLAPFIERNDSHSGCLALAPPMNQRIADLIASVREELDIQPDELWPCRSRSRFLELLLILFNLHRGATQEGLQELPASLAGRVIQHIHAHLDQPLSITEFCRCFAMNRTSLNAAMVAATGDSVIQFANRTRIQSACLLLRDTSLPVQEIAEGVGCRDITHFGRIFRKFAGASPRHYREDARST